MAKEVSAEPPKSEPDSKSGICTPAGYNGKAPASIAAPTKIYPGSSQIGRGGSKGMVEGPASKSTTRGRG